MAEMDFGELTLEADWRNRAGDVVMVNKIFHISPGDTVSLPYPTVVITSKRDRKEEK